MQINRCEPSFNGVKFLNKKSFAKAGLRTVLDILNTPAAKAFKKNSDYDLVLRRKRDVVEWKMLPASNGPTDKMRNYFLPWVSLLDLSSLSKVAAERYIKTYIKKSRPTNVAEIANPNLAYLRERRALGIMRQAESESEYYKTMNQNR